MLEIKNLHVNYGAVAALRGISLEIKEREIVTIIGSNGAGKTTTLLSVSGLVYPVEGSISFRGTELIDMAPDMIVRLGIAHVPEGRKIFPMLTVQENLRVGALGNPKLSKTQIKNLMEEQFERFPRLKERLKQAGGSLSGGEQQMLAIARGLMLDPDLLMLDEPSLGLAPIVVDEIFELILKIQKDGKTVLLIEQNASLALSIADRGYVLENGKITLSGSGKELLGNENIKRAYLGG